MTIFKLKIEGPCIALEAIAMQIRADKDNLAWATSESHFRTGGDLISRDFGILLVIMVARLTGYLKGSSCN